MESRDDAGNLRGVGSREPLSVQRGGCPHHEAIELHEPKERQRLTASVPQDDLPAAVAHAAPILAKEGMGDRVVHRAGDALTDDFGTSKWDLVFVSQLLHHFNEATNREFARRVTRALKPGGVFVILELTRPSSPQGAGQIGALLDLYFALTSQSGTWSVEEMSVWQRDAGLVPQKPIHLRTMPGAAEVVAVKPR